MHLRSMHLRNYRKYRDQSIDFPTGVIGVVGKNGSGKSTLIEAIGWCLYGSNAARTGSEEIRTAGITSEDCSVTLEFVLGSDAVRVVRELKGKNASVRASVFLNGDADAHVRGSKDVSDYIAKRTGMDRVAFFASVFAQQKELSAFSDLRPGERKKTVMRLLRIDKVDEALSAVREDIRRGEEKIQMLKGNLKDTDRLESERGRAEMEKMGAEKEISRHDRAVKKAEAAEKETKADFSDHEKKYRKHSAIDKKITVVVEKARSKEREKIKVERDQKKARDAKRQLDDMRPQLEEYEITKRQKEDLDEAYGQFMVRNEQKKRRDALASKINGMVRANERYEKRLARMPDLDAKLQSLEADLSRRRSRVESLTGQISDASAKIREASKKKREYGANLAVMKKQGRDGACPTCNRPLQDYLPVVTKRFEDDISGLKEEIRAGTSKKKELESRLQSAKDAEENTSGKIEKTRKQINERESLQDKLEDGEKNRKSLEEEMESIKMIDSSSVLKYDSAHHRAVDKKWDRLQQVKDRSMKLSGSVGQIPDLEKQREQCLGDIAKLAKKRTAEEERLKAIGYDGAQYNKSKLASERATAKLANARVKKSELRAKLREASLRLEQIEDSVREEKRKREKIREEEEKTESRSRLERVMGGFRSDLMSRIRPMLSQRASELLGRITRGRYALVDLDDDYNIRVEDNGESFTTDRFSGGEEDLANLCLRIAISQELAERSGWEQINFIALDEIFGSQDEERKRRVLDALQTLSEQFRQILVITHIEDVKEALPYVLNVQEGVGGASSVTVEGSIRQSGDYS